MEVLVVLLEAGQHGVERQKGDGHHGRRRRAHRHRHAATAAVVAVAAAACRTCAARVDSADTAAAAAEQRRGELIHHMRREYVHHRAARGHNSAPVVHIAAIATAVATAAAVAADRVRIAAHAGQRRAATATAAAAARTLAACQRLQAVSRLLVTRLLGLKQKHYKLKFNLTEETNETHPRRFACLLLQLVLLSVSIVGVMMLAMIADESGVVGSLGYGRDEALLGAIVQRVRVSIGRAGQGGCSGGQLGSCGGGDRSRAAQ